MFQYAALERNNTTEPLEGRREVQVSSGGSSAPTLYSYSITHPALANPAAHCSDAAWNYSICSGGEIFVQRYKSATKMM